MKLKDVKNGVCLLCGSGVLRNGEHIRDDLDPCYGKPSEPVSFASLEELTDYLRTNYGDKAEHSKRACYGCGNPSTASNHVFCRSCKNIFDIERFMYGNDPMSCWVWAGLVRGWDMPFFVGHCLRCAECDALIHGDADYLCQECRS